MLAMNLPSPAYALRREAIGQSAGLKDLTGGLEEDPRSVSEGREEEVFLPGASTRYSFGLVWDDFRRWTEQQRGVMSFLAGPRYGHVPVRLHNHEMETISRISVLPDPAWAAQFHELTKLQGNTGMGHLIPGAFGQLGVRVYLFDGGRRKAVLIEEVQPGEGYRKQTAKRQHQIDGWRRWAVEQIVRWAEARGHVVFGPQRAMYDHLAPYEIRKNYTEVFRSDRWKPVAFSVGYAAGGLSGAQHRYAYLGNEAITARWSRDPHTTGGLEEQMPGWLQQIVPADEFPVLIRQVHERAMAQTVVLFESGLLPEESPGDLAAQLAELSGTVPAALGIGDLGPWEFDTWERRGRYPTDRYHVIRVSRHPESALGRLGSWSAVPLIVAQAIAAGRTTFHVNLDTYAPVEQVPLADVLAQFTDLFA